MRTIVRNLLVAVTVVIVLSLLIFAEYSQAATLRPWVRFGGFYQVTAGIGTGSLTLNATVREMDYNDGTIWKANVNGVETIFGARVVLSGATRTGNYSFNGDPANPNDVTLSIVSSDGYVYFTSILVDSVFTQQGTNFVWLNQFLDANKPETLDLINVTLRPNGDDGLHPSRYINELAIHLGSQNVSGMRMQLFVPSTMNFTTNSSGAISSGLIDGLQALNTPPVANAGGDVTIPSNQVAATTIDGTVTDADAAYTLTCRWTETDESGNVLRVLNDWTAVGIDGACPLNLGGLLPGLSLGMHILTLEANDGEITSSDNMVLTINNSVPNANAGNDVTVTSEEVAATTIQGSATDFDNSNILYCKWTEGLTVLQDWTPAEGGACPLSGLTLGIGTHTLTLEASDGLATSSDDMVLTIINTPPVANAGVNITIFSEQILITTLQGTATDFDGNALTCRWTHENGDVLQDWTAVIDGACPLNLVYGSLVLGSQALTLTVDDGQTSTSDDMVLTIDNSAPHAAPGGAGIYEVNSTVTLPGDVSDYDGDMLHYNWSEGTNIICSGDIQAIATGTPVWLPDCIVSNLSLGTHTISLEVSDEINSPDKKDVTVVIIDSSAPTVAPIASQYIMWPPNHIMVNIAINANAVDNSGLPVTLTAIVTSNEPLNGLGDGDTGPNDWTNPVIDQNTGRIDLQLRRERSGRGTGRVYTITITATDSSGNTSTAKVNIAVPHDMAKK